MESRHVKTRILRAVGMSLALGAVSILPACVQLGDFAEGAECEPALGDLTAAVTEELGTSWEPDSFVLYPSGPKPWCTEWVETGLDLAVDDDRRVAVATRLTATVAELREGVVFTVEYAPGDEDTFASPTTTQETPAQ